MKKKIILLVSLLFLLIGGVCSIGMFFGAGLLANWIRDPEAVYAAYLAAVERAKREGLDREEVERYRRVLYAGFVSEFDYPEDIADLLCEAELGGNVLFDTLRAIDEVTYEEVCALLDAFDERATVFTVLYPEDEDGEDDGYQEDDNDEEDM